MDIQPTVGCMSVTSANEVFWSPVVGHAASYLGSLKDVGRVYQQTCDNTYAMVAQ